MYQTIMYLTTTITHGSNQYKTQQTYKYPSNIQTFQQANMRTIRHLNNQSHRDCNNNEQHHYYEYDNTGIDPRCVIAGRIAMDSQSDS